MKTECYECGELLPCEREETRDGDEVDICAPCALCVNYLKDNPLDEQEDSE